MNDDERFPASQPGRWDTARTWRRPGGLAVLVAVAAIGLAACGSGSSSPHVASLGTSSSGNGSGSSAGSGTGSGAAKTPTDNPTRLLDEWAACMRSHGDSGQADPIIDASKTIHITMSSSVPGGIYGYSGQSGSGPGRFCLAYLNAAANALDGGHPPHQPSSRAQLLKYAECMRANGITNYPDPPTGGGGAFNLGALDPTSRTFQNADKVCYKKTGWQGLPGVGPPQPGDVVPSYSGNGG